MSGAEISNYSSMTTVTYSDVQGGYGGTGNLNADPKFVAAAAGNYHLRVGSPCIDTGTTTGAPTTDLDGTPRDATPDLGAYEFIKASGPVIYVSAAALGRDNGTSWTDAFMDLQDGLAAASSGQEIWVAAGDLQAHAGPGPDGVVRAEGWRGPLRGLRRDGDGPQPAELGDERHHAQR